MTRSHSRPKVSNDNPTARSWFKTLKYAPTGLERFASIHHARDFMDEFVAWYNHEHRHSGIGLHTPADVFCGLAEKKDTRAAPCSLRPEHATGTASAAMTRQRSSTYPRPPRSTRPNHQNRRTRRQPPNTRWTQTP